MSADAQQALATATIAGLQAAVQAVILATSGPQSITGLTAPTAASGTTVTATATTAAPIGIVAGAQIPLTIAGATPAAFNGAVTATVTGPSSFTYPVTSSGSAMTATGTITYMPAAVPTFSDNALTQLSITINRFLSNPQ
jgi:uncharacterized RmlC-like cupin family protein